MSFPENYFILENRRQNRRNRRFTHGKDFLPDGQELNRKDTIYKMLRDEKALQLQTIVPYTTRPIRAGETEGVEYHFIDEQRLLKLEKKESHRAARI